MTISGILTATFSYLFAGLSHGDVGYGGTMVTSFSSFNYIYFIYYFFKTVK